MKEIIASNTADGATDWKAAADEYAKWRATTFGYEYKPYEDKPRAQGPEEDWYGMRVLAEKSIRSMLIDPESARFEWPRGFMRSSWKPSIFGKRVKGYVSCGLVNSRNRMGGYAGTAPFVVVIDNGRVLHASIGTEQDFDITSIGCREAMKQLPPPQEAMLKTQPTSPPAASIADEIAKLASLRDRGILTQAEFDEQKALLLRH